MRLVLLQNGVRKEQGCQLPRPDPFDPTILEFIRKPPALQCNGDQHDLTYLSNDEWLRINFTTIRYNKLKVACFYRCFDRIDDDDENIHYDQWVRFNDTVRPECEFVETSCERTSFPRVTIYRNNHNQILKRKGTSLAINSGAKSVILIVLDSISHSNFVRNMPKSLEVLKSVYKSHIFDGMNKIGDQSFPNAVAFLAGRDHQTEFGDVKGFFDEHPLIWKEFEKANYTTYYAEDYPDFNLFNYLAKGFKKKPVHHYFRPFWLNVYGSYLHRRSKYLCYGTQAMHNIQLNYLSQFLRKYRDSPKFALNWLTELGHDYMNKVNVADDDFANFLLEHYDELKNSFLFVLSDHGHRFDSIRRTAIGRIEESLPFFSMHIPMDLRQRFPRITKTVESNTQILTTFWDFYVTMRDILDLGQNNKWEEFHGRKISQINASYSRRGLSLLRPIKDRNCKEAGIPDQFCPCYGEASVDTTNLLVSVDQLE
ncbi:hypothetical protein KIN20_024492 [Parelaphostrongylus tenuis]|uniref:DUF229 domain containing protein n=1 Tax=Parelaphostrongylus tenuis TaxID=148309 RepID=A0AAD5NB71_PARTN|nr:hypothetical protein KIN20_024492 [Parelaphostrongylus tenuis]